jgi:hypothetical protein
VIFWPETWISVGFWLFFAQNKMTAGNRHIKALHHTCEREGCNKCDVTAVPWFFDWSIIMIRPSGWLLVVSHVFVLPVLLLKLRLQKNK